MKSIRCKKNFMLTTSIGLVVLSLCSVLALLAVYFEARILVERSPGILTLQPLRISAIILQGLMVGSIAASVLALCALYRVLHFYRFPLETARVLVTRAKPIDGGECQDPQTAARRSPGEVPPRYSGSTWEEF